MLTSVKDNIVIITEINEYKIKYNPHSKEIKLYQAIFVIAQHMIMISWKQKGGVLSPDLFSVCNPPARPLLRKIPGGMVGDYRSSFKHQQYLHLERPPREHPSCQWSMCIVPIQTTGLCQLE